MKSFIMGIGSFSFCIGFLIGASNTPVVGAVITGILAISGTFWGILKDRKSDQSPKFDLKISGVVLTVFSSVMLIGVFCGEGYKREWFIPEKTDLLWDDYHLPSSGHEALDWLMVQNKLHALGYSKEQIKSIYQLSEKWDYTEEKPYHMMLSSEELAQILASRNEPFGPVNTLSLDQIYRDEISNKLDTTDFSGLEK